MKRTISVRRHLRRRLEPAVERGELKFVAHDQRKQIGYADGEQVMLFRGGRVFHRDAELPVPGRSIVNESAVYTLDKVLGWDVVPPTTMRLVGGEDEPRTIYGVMEYENAEDWDTAFGEYGRGKIPKDELKKVADPEDVMKIALLDFITGEGDRHSGNIIVNMYNKKVWAIDNESALFEGDDERAYPNSVAVEAVRGQEIPEKLKRDLRELEEGDFRAALAGVNKVAVDNAWKRKERIQRFKIIPSRPVWEGVRFR